MSDDSCHVSSPSDPADMGEGDEYHTLYGVDRTRRPWRRVPGLPARHRLRRLRTTLPASSGHLRAPRARAPWASDADCDDGGPGSEFRPAGPIQYDSSKGSRKYGRRATHHRVTTGREASEYMYQHAIANWGSWCSLPGERGFTHFSLERIFQSSYGRTPSRCFFFFRAFR